MTSAHADRRARGGVVFALGFYALAAQALLFRAFFSVYEGNELGLGVFFSSWLLWAGFGAWLGRLDLGRRATGSFDVLALIYLPAFFLQHALVQRSRALAGIAPFELFPFLRLAPVSLLVNAPVSLVTGFLFTRACDWMRGEDGLPPARVYGLEALGGFAGGIAVTALLAAGLAEERLALLAGLVPAGALLVRRAGRGRRLWFAAPAALLLAALALGADRAWQDANLQRTWSRLLPEESWRGQFSTPQARYLFGELEGQFVVRSWASVIESIPDHDHASEVAALALAQAPAARRILVVGSGYSLCARFLDMPEVESVTWLCPDPEYPARLLAELPEARRAAAGRLNLPRVEARRYLRETAARYDLAVLNLPDATTLSQNRYFTVEFYRLLRERLTPGGVAAARCSGGENFLGRETRHGGASALATLGAVFARQALRPGEETWFFASDGADLTESGEEASDRFRAIPGAETLYPPDRLRSQFPPDRIALQRRAYETAAAETPPGWLINTDHHPKALLFSLLRAGLQEGWGPGTVAVLHRLGRLGWPVFLAPLILIAALRLAYRWRGAGMDGRAPDAGVLVFTAGWAGMTFSLTLMFLFQALWGALFLHVGLASALFMLGLYGGAAGGARLIRARGAEGAWLLPAALGGHLALIGLVAAAAERLGPAGFALLFLVGGAFGGLYVPPAVARLKAAGRSDRAAGAILEGLDTLGGAAGGLLTGLFALPMLGFSGSLALAAAMLLVNAPVLLARRGAAPADAAERWARRVGYAAAGLVLLAFISTRAAERADAPAANARLLAAAEQLAPGRAHAVRQALLPDDRAVNYLELKPDAAGPGGYLFTTDQTAPEISGYGGPITMAVFIGPDGVLLDLQVLEHHETPPYFRRTEAWIRSLTGWNLFDAADRPGVDGATGATMTSQAIAETLRASGERLARDILRMAPAGDQAPRAGPVEGAAGALAVFAAAALVLRARPGRRRRRVFLAAAVLVLGVRLNLQYSLAHVLAALSGSWPAAGLTTAFLLTFGVPLLAALFGNLYCGHLCPFGAAQELAAEWRPASWSADPPKPAWRYARWLKYALFFVLAGRYALTRDARLMALDPLATVFQASGSRLIWLFAATVLALSVFFRRFWCRNLCPAGAFLSMVNGLKMAFRWLPGIRPGCCDLGVRHARELDCILCDRCHAGLPPAARLGPLSRTLALAAALAGMAVVWGPLLWRAAATGMEPTPGRPSPARRIVMDTHRARDVDMTRLDALLRRGRLSSREALHYRRLNDEAERPESRQD